MIVFPRGRTTRRSLVWDMLFPYSNVSSYSTPICPTVLEVRVLIYQSAPVSVVRCSPEDVTMPQGTSHDGLGRCSMGFRGER
ncbi:hypothetical protein TNCV_3323631 [Trichonephila clavipes]|nr:hypothetical protein TNCV_3323631 [Trichonephila clavipes]